MLHYHVKLAKKKQQLHPLERHDVSREGLVVDVFAPPEGGDTSTTTSPLTEASSDPPSIAFPEQPVLQTPTVKRRRSAKQACEARVEPNTGKLLCGPVILKVDSGPGRIIANLESISKRAEFLELGLLILMGLPNATSVNQEMDALYGAFKSATYARGEIILTERLRRRGR
jgi:hypothetical protein